jgi:hypothetical protein
MESMIEVARAHPNFENERLARKVSTRFVLRSRDQKIHHGERTSR